MSYEVYAHSSIMTLAKVLIALTGLLFAVCLALYIWRSRTFPIAQRFPVLVMVESVSFALMGFYILLVIAYPFDADVSNCKVYNWVMAVGEMVGMVTSTIRVVLVLGKDLRTRDLIKKEGDLGTIPQVYGLADSCALLIENAIRFTWRFLSDIQIASLVALPVIVISMSIFSVLPSGGDLGRLLITDAECFTMVGRKMIMYQIGIFVYLGIGFDIPSQTER
jgi:hypothetical protein